MTKRRSSTGALAELTGDSRQTREQRRLEIVNQPDDQRPLGYRERIVIDRNRKRRPPAEPSENPELSDRTRARPIILSIPGASRSRL